MLKLILKQISQGNTSVDDISQKLGMQKSAVMAAIKTLVSFGCLERSITCRQLCSKCDPNCFRISPFLSLSRKGEEFLEK
jgi:predicted transcriptional regulator